MSKLKSNPVVFPFLDFKNLNNKKLSAVFLKRKIVDWNYIKNLIIQINSKKITLRGKTIEEKILSIFLNKNYLFGSKKYILDYKNYWLDKIKFFTQKNEKIKFSILGFPFKAPLILKTPRVCPDMGDVLALNQLKNIIKIIEKTYSPGAEIYIITEGCFGKLNNISQKNVNKYQRFLRVIIKKLEMEEFIKIKPLDKLEKYQNFKKTYHSNINYFKELYKKKDQNFLKNYELAYPSIYHIVNPKTKNINLLMDVYNKRLEKVNEKIKKIRKILEKNTHISIIKYFAYLKTRDDLNFLDNEVPNALALSVSPKPKRLGILQISKSIKRLPHHGVTIYNEKKKEFTIEYFIDILKNHKKYQPIYLKDDFDNKPFLYIEN